MKLNFFKRELCLLLPLCFIFYQSRGQEGHTYFPEQQTPEEEGRAFGKESTDKRLYQASRQYNVGAFQDAILLYDRIITEDPYFAEAYYGRAICFEAMNNPEEALRDYDIAIHLDPMMIEAYFNSGVLRFAMGDYRNAIPFFEKLLAIPKQPTNSVYFQGVQYGSNSEPMLTGVVSMAKNTEPIVYDYMGKCYSALGDYAHAEENFLQAIAIEPSAGLYLSLGNLKKKMGKPQEALLQYQKALRLDPDNSLAIYLSTITAYEVGEQELSLSALDKVIAGDRPFPEAYLNRGLLRYESGDFAGALADYDSAIQLNRLLSDAWLNRGLVKERMQDYKGALADFDQAILLDRNDPRAFLYRGNVKYKMHQYNAALEDYNSYILINNTNPKAFYNRALVAHKLELENIVCEDIQEAITLGMDEAIKVKKAYCDRKE